MKLLSTDHQEAALQLSTTPWFDPDGWTAGIHNVLFAPRRVVTMSRLAEITREFRTEIDDRAAHPEDHARVS